MTISRADDTANVHRPLSEYELSLISSANVAALPFHLLFLKSTKQGRYISMVYIALHSSNTDVFIIALASLIGYEKPDLVKKPTLQELRLLYVAATVPNLEHAKLGLFALTEQLLLAKCFHLNDRPLFDFVLEIISQKPLLLSKGLLQQLVCGREDTDYGKKILKHISIVFNTNVSQFWQRAKELHAFVDDSPLKAKL